MNYIRYVFISSCSGRYFRHLEKKACQDFWYFGFYSEGVQTAFYMEIFLVYENKEILVAFKRGFKGINASTWLPYAHQKIFSFHDTTMVLSFFLHSCVQHSPDPFEHCLFLWDDTTVWRESCECLSFSWSLYFTF